MNGYEQNYELLVSGLASCNFEEAAGRLGIGPPVDGCVSIDYLGRAYTVCRDGVFPLDGQASDPNDRSILIHYITSKGSGDPVHQYYLPYHFAHSVFSGGESSLFSRQIQAGMRDLASVQQAMAALGAVYRGEIRSCEHVWRYRILPKMPIEVIYCEADDEFPCDIKIKFDGTAGRYMEFETLMFLCGSFLHGLSRLCQAPGTAHADSTA